MNKTSCAERIMIFLFAVTLYLFNTDETGIAKKPQMPIITTSDGSTYIFMYNPGEKSWTDWAKNGSDKNITARRIPTVPI